MWNRNLMAHYQNCLNDEEKLDRLLSKGLTLKIYWLPQIFALKH